MTKSSVSEWGRALLRALACAAVLAACSGSSVVGADGGADMGPRCTAAETTCGGRCANTQSDPTNCGACGTACAGGQACVMGACQTVCPAGQTVCAGTCASTQTDRAHCGACGRACPAGQVCTMGACALECGGGTMRCGAAGAEACVDPRSDRRHCGRCGNTCLPGQVCEAGACIGACPGTQTLCGSRCVETDSDRLNCGACGTACPAGQVCSQGRCALECGAPLTLCGPPGADAGMMMGGGTDAAADATPGGDAGPPGMPYCADTRVDRANCGACGNACPAGQVCSMGACALDCRPPLTGCGSGATAFCADTRNDPRNCGACGAACPARANAAVYCADGRCATACAVGFADCNGNADDGCEVDTRASSAHCGVCGNACPVGQLCTSGRCALTCPAGQSVCGGACVNTQTNPDHCGACGTACPGRRCVGGACTTYASCHELLQAFPRLPSGTYTIDPDGPGSGMAAIRAYCDMTTLGGGWTLLTNHQASAGYFGNASRGLFLNTSDPTAGLYSILGLVDSFRREGRYEFLYWNRQFDQQIVNRQTSSPLDPSRTNGCAADNNVVISTYRPGLFCGYTPGPATWSTINGYGPNWTHAVGQFMTYSSWPLVCTHDSGYQCNHYQFYVR